MGPTVDGGAVGVKAKLTEVFGGLWDVDRGGWCTEVVRRGGWRVGDGRRGAIGEIRRVISRVVRGG